MLRILRGIGYVIAVTLCQLSLVHAQPSGAAQVAAPIAAPLTAKDYLEAGKRAYDAGLFEEALRDFEGAYVRSQEPRTLYHIGLAAEKLGQHVRAVIAFQEYLDLVPAASDRASIEQRILDDQRASQARVEPVGSPLSASVAAASEAPAPAPAQPTPAPQMLAAAYAAAPSATVAPRSATAAQSSAKITEPAAPLAAEPSPAAPQGAVQPLQPPEAEARSRHRAGPWWLWVGAGALAVGGIVAAALLTGASHARTPEPVHGNVGGTVETLTAP